MRIKYDSNVGGLALFIDEEGETEPDFKKQAMQRQRECMTVGLCQVCARPVPWSRRHLVLDAGMSIGHVEINGRLTPVVTEP